MVFAGAVFEVGFGAPYACSTVYTVPFQKAEQQEGFPYATTEARDVLIAGGSFVGLTLAKEITEF